MKKDPEFNQSENDGDSYQIAGDYIVQQGLTESQTNELIDQKLSELFENNERFIQHHI